MKKINKILYGAIGVMFILASCSKDFLEERPTGVLTNERMAEVSKYNPAISKAGVDGMYSLLIQWKSGGTSSHDDFGPKSFDIRSDIMCGDMAQIKHAYGRFQGISDLTGLEKTGLDTYRFWRFYYQLVKSANSVLDAFGEEIPQEDENKFNYGQASALRAYAYLYLVNFYQLPYPEAKDQNAVILYLKNEEEGKGLSTVQEIYNAIISDLEKAVKALDGFKRKNNTSIDQNVAKGLLAYAYLFMEDYAKAEAVANEVIASGEFKLMSSDEVIKSGFNNVNIPGWMWAIDLTTDNSPLLPTFWGMIDIFTYSYADVVGWAINKELYAQIPQTDIRKKQFFNKPGHAFDLFPINKFYHKDRKQGTKDWTSDEVFMRVAEMYLAKAEAQARQGKEADAKTTLLQLVSQRDTNANGRINPLAGNDLLDEIYFQWRIEMWGEGKAFWAMKRFKKTNKRGTNSFMYPGQEFPYNDPKLIAKIPEIELNANPNIK